MWCKYFCLIHTKIYRRCTGYRSFSKPIIENLKLKLNIIQNSNFVVLLSFSPNSSYLKCEWKFDSEGIHPTTPQKGAEFSLCVRSNKLLSHTDPFTWIKKVSASKQASLLVNPFPRVFTGLWKLEGIKIHKNNFKK